MQLTKFLPVYQGQKRDLARRRRKNLPGSSTTLPVFPMGDLLLLAITCVCRLHWSARLGSWSRVIRWVFFLLFLPFLLLCFLFGRGRCLPSRFRPSFLFLVFFVVVVVFFVVFVVIARSFSWAGLLCRCRLGRSLLCRFRFCGRRDLSRRRLRRFRFLCVCGGLVFVIVSVIVVIALPFLSLFSSSFWGKRLHFAEDGEHPAGGNCFLLRPAAGEREGPPQARRGAGCPRL